MFSNFQCLYNFVTKYIVIALITLHSLKVKIYRWGGGDCNVQKYKFFKYKYIINVIF